MQPRELAAETDLGCMKSQRRRLREALACLPPHCICLEIQVCGDSRDLGQEGLKRQGRAVLQLGQEETAPEREKQAAGATFRHLCQLQR